MAYTYTITSQPSGQGPYFKIVGNQLAVNTSNIPAGSYPITVRANDGQSSIIDQNMVIVATSAASPPSAGLKFNLTSNSQYIGTLIGGL